MGSGLIPSMKKSPERDASCKKDLREGEESSMLLAFILKSDFVGPKTMAFTTLRSVLRAAAI